MVGVRYHLHQLALWRNREVKELDVSSSRNNMRVLGVILLPYSLDTSQVELVKRC